MTITHDEIEKRFTHHPPADEGVAELHEAIRWHAKEMAYEIAKSIPECREKSLAITKLEESLMWANAAIAREISAGGGS